LCFDYSTSSLVVNTFEYVSGSRYALQPAVVTLLTSATKSDNVQLTHSTEDLLGELENHLQKAASASDGVSCLNIYYIASFMKYVDL